MKAVLFALATLAVMAAIGVVIGSQAQAAERPARCRLVVDGKTYIDGPCRYDADPDGSFRVFGVAYFAYVTTTGKGVAEATWNADPKSEHAQAPLGTLTRKGACWVGSHAEICAWMPASRR